MGHMANSKTKDIKQSVRIAATPRAVYEALMDSKKHTKFTGEKAVISRKVGGSFKAYGGYATGKNIELVTDKKIVQSWRTSQWPAGYHSVTTFLLSPTKGGTKLMFIHKGVPVEDANDIADGWKEYYWEPLKLMLEEK